MSVFSGLFKSRDKPQNRTSGSNYAFFMGGTTSGKTVTERSAMQMTAVYSCVRILSEAVAGLPLHLYKYTDSGGKAMALDHPLYRLLHDEPNPEMSSFVFRETLMTHLLLWGNANFADIGMDKELYDGHVVDAALTDTAYIVLLDDGSVAYSGDKATSLLATDIPAGAKSGVVSIAATANSVAALKNDGTVLTWGVTTRGEGALPAFSTKPIKIEGGRYHYTVVMEDGNVASWGHNRYKQINVPTELTNDSVDVKNIFTGYYQNYAIDANGKMHTWGLKGFLLGTDDLGRDIFARLVNGGKMTMTIGALSVVISTIIGILLGGIAGYFGGFLDMAIMRIAEVVSSMPFIPFAMILSAVLGSQVSVEQRMYIIMVILGLLSWPGLCRQVRAQMFAQREMEYVTAAKTIGVKENKIIFKHIIPNVMSVVLVSITLSFGTSMLTESTLSYLGFGIPAPTPTWGNMLSNANNSVIIQNYWWNWVFVGLIFGLSCVCINLIGDGLRDALDPKSNER